MKIQDEHMTLDKIEPAKKVNTKQTEFEAKECPADHVKKLRELQLGSNGYQGN
jgi:hypothetical protein